MGGQACFGTGSSGDVVKKPKGEEMVLLHCKRDNLLLTIHVIRNHVCYDQRLLKLLQVAYPCIKHVSVSPDECYRSFIIKMFLSQNGSELIMTVLILRRMIQ